PASSRCHVGSTPQPRGETIPRPVTTTRLIWIGSGPGSPPWRWPPTEQRLLGCSVRPLQRAAPGKMQRGRVYPAPHARQAVSRLRCRSRLRAGLLEKAHRIAHGDYRLRGIVGNFDAELLLEGHHQFDRIERVGPEIINKIGV